jgi:hypothetical protein
MTDMLIGTLLFVTGLMTGFYFTVRTITPMIRRLADKYEDGNVEKLLK